ncbi:MAG: ImmA/IrrE family metallo-endopeptidase [Eubacteriales bacterium]|nr:ImmA/IrrE family metallo-endopeptidase [Eubacteriales bacterium]
MRFNDADSIIRKANRLVRLAGCHNADTIAKELGITIIPVKFSSQKGVYKVIERNRYIFIKDNLDDIMRNIVILHEIGHDQLHRGNETIFQEFNIFDMQGDIMEYEANLFAAQILLPDDDIIDYIYQGYDAGHIARAMNSDINLVALKVGDLSRRGYAFRELEHRNDFLK